MVTSEENALIERLIEAGTPALAIRAAVPSVSRTNIYLKIQKYKKHGTVGRVQTKTLGRPRAMDKTLEGFLQGLLVAKPHMELDEMRRLMQDRMGVSVSLSTISRAVTRAGISNGRLCRVKNPTQKRRARAVVAPATAAEGAGTATVDEHAMEGALDPDTQYAPQHDQSSQQLDLSAWDHIGDAGIDGGPAHHLPHAQHHRLSQQHDLLHMTHLPPHQHDSSMHAHDNTMQAHDNTMHALDPSLASPFAQATVAYHANVYADLSRVAPHATMGMNAVPNPNLDYRSPYAPL